MEYKEYKAKTVDDAVTNAQQDLGLTSSEIEYVILDKGSKGFLGIGARQAVIKARKKELSKSVKPERTEKFVKTERSEKPVKKEFKESNKDQKKNAGKGSFKKAGDNQPKDQAKNRLNNSAKDNSLKAAKPEKVKEEKPIEEINVEEYFDKAINFIKDVTREMGEDVTVTASKGEEINSIDLTMSGDNMGIFIGKRGQTLDALQYLTSIVLNGDTKSYIRVKLDTEDYRSRRKATLENLAFNMAKKAIRINKRVTLEPMNPYERRIIHAALQSNKKVDTFSEGVEPYRKVVIVPNTK